MTLVHMVAVCEDELICDFAEYYHVYNLRGLMPSYAATLAFGLCDDSRTKRKLSGQTVPQHILLLAAAVDRLSVLAWQNTADGQKGKNLPRSLVDMLTGKAEEKTFQTFESGEAFEAARRRILEGS